jgi:superfamily II DNA helicase RecQ
MAYKFITISIQDAGVGEAELNAFLRGRRVLAVERRWVDAGLNSCWAICVDYLERMEPVERPPRGQGKNRVDYREVLGPEDFAVFARLRQWRKETAEAESVPVYTIFTNEQLAEMARQRVTTREGLERIAGVGDGRIDKYGSQVLDQVRQAAGGKVATDGQPV